MSRLEEIKKGIREQGLITSESLIQEFAEQQLHYEKLKNLPMNVTKIIKDNLKKSS